MKRTVEYALSGGVRTQARSGLTVAVLANPAGRDLEWTLMQARCPDLEETLAGFAGTSRIIEGVGAFCDADMARRW